EEVLPWMITGFHVRKQWFVWVATVNAYAGEVATLLAGLGIGAPLVAVLQGKSADGKPVIDQLRQILPGELFWIGVVALAAWGLLRVVVARENVMTRALFAKDCANT